MTTMVDKGEIISPKIIPKDVDVAIIGNGPSGIFLSFLLSGYRPYFTGVHPDPFLTHKLSQNPDRSVLDQDLQSLSEGLEGRSGNQLALLMDTLLLPNTDIGEHHPSSIYWKQEPSLYIPHIVIGGGKPGGSWQNMSGEVKSLSLASWLQLPGYNFEEWALDKSVKGAGNRVSLGGMAEYYTDYVAKMGLEEAMVDGVQVTKVKECPPPVRCHLGSPKPSSASSSPSPVSVCCSLPFHTVDSGLSLSEVSSFCTKYTDSSCDSYSDSEDDGVSCGENLKNYKWCVKGVAGSGSDVVVRSKTLVLACGVGSPKHLGVMGEENIFVSHQFSDFYQKLSSLDKNSTVVVVGAGLSAADAVLLCIKKGLKVVHIFSQDPQDPSLVYNKMNNPLYSEYRNILMLMKGESHNRLYTPVPQSTVLQFTNHNLCIYEDSRKNKVQLSVSLAGIFVGSEADLGFLPKRIRSSLAVDPLYPVNARSNPVNVDPLTFETEACSTLYALGPLVGDHFVRFVLGSGLGACKHLVDNLK